MGDADGDGTADLLLGSAANDRAWLFYGPLAGELTVADADVVMTGTAGAGISVGFVGDHDGDGNVDLAIGANAGGADSGRVYLVDGPLALGEIDMDLDADLILNGSGGERLGWIWPIGDYDGDGTDDFAAGAPGADGDHGALYVVEGDAAAPLAGTLPVATAATATFSGVTPPSAVGESAVDAGDLDGDGQIDLFIGAFNDAGMVGEAYVVVGHRTGDVDLSVDADVTLIGESVLSLTAWYGGFMPDVDGDGRDEVVVGAPMHDFYASSLGRTYVVFSGSL